MFLEYNNNVSKDAMWFITCLNPSWTELIRKKRWKLGRRERKKGRKCKNERESTWTKWVM